jgi:hypothetical protein
MTLHLARRRRPGDRRSVRNPCTALKWVTAGCASCASKIEAADLTAASADNIKLI